MKIINREPFIYMQSNKNSSKKNEIIYNQQLRQSRKYFFYETALDFIYDNSIEGSYFEFGVHKARTFRFFLNIADKKNLKMNCFAFDSFQGLPDYKLKTFENKHHKNNKLKTSRKNFEQLVKKYLNKRKLKIVEGWYDDTLDNKLIKKFKKDNVKTCFITLDCNLVISMKKALNFALNFYVDGTILYVDDYYTSNKGNPKKGTPKLINETLSRKKINFIKWVSVGSFGQSFILYK